MAASMESYFKVALNQFVGHFSEVCNEKEMQLTLKETGDAVKPDLLFRMMYELILSEAPTEDYQPAMPKTKIPEARGRTEDQAPRPSSTYTGIKVSFKDIKKVEKEAKLQFPFMPDFIDYKCNNSCCQCLRVCGNMFVPCGTHVKDWDPEDGTPIPTCKTCTNQKNAENYGTLAMRMEAYEAGRPYVAPEKEKEEGAEENAKGPKGPKKEVTFATYLAKKGLLGDDSKLRTAKLNEKIQELEGLIFQETNLSYSFGPEHLTIDKSKVRASKKSGDGEAKRGRGRPKKERSASVSSTSSEEENISQHSSPVQQDPVEENVPEKENDPVVEEELELELDMDEVNASDVEEESVSDLEPADDEPEPEPEKPKEKPESPKEEPEKPKEEPEKPKEEPEKPKEEPEKEQTKATKKLKKVTVNGKVLFIDRADKTVYDENMEYYGDFDKEKGRIVPLK